MTSSALPAGALHVTRTRIAWRVLAAAPGALAGLLVCISAVTAVQLGWSWADALDAFVLTNAVMAVAFAGCGVILAWHRPGNPIGWLFVTGGLLQAVAAAVPPVGEVLRDGGASTPLLRLLVTVFVYSWPWAIGLCIPLALMLFPDGRPVSRHWRPVILLVIITAPLFVLELGAAPLPVEDGGTIGLPHPAHLRPAPAAVVDGRAPHHGRLPAGPGLAVRPVPARATKPFAASCSGCCSPSSS